MTMPQRFQQLPALVPDSPPARSPKPEARSLAVQKRTDGQARQARELWIGVHLPLIESAMLERLAGHVQRFTPRVSLAPPDGLLLEVRGSLHLFDGAQALCHTVVAECARLVPGARVALAPAAYAAIAGARAGISFVITDPARLIGCLASLPLSALRWPEDVVDRLSHIGVRSVGQALRLPRTGFARRFGAVQLESLDRLTGRRADPRLNFRARERFRVRREPSCELESRAAILASLETPLSDLERFLRARQCGITELRMRLHHRHAPSTPCMLSLAAPEADAGRFLALATEKLSQLVLPEPVRSIELRSGPLVARATLSASLWQPGEQGGGAGQESPVFIELLRMRLGTNSVYGLELTEAHRPEAAWRTAAYDAALVRRDARSRGRLHEPQVPWPRGRRPLWLLNEPQNLAGREGQPQYHGALQLLGEPERIETGWWDGADAARDYYVARDVRGTRLWVYRERAQPHRWFLHGFFG